MDYAGGKWTILKSMVEGWDLTGDRAASEARRLEDLETVYDSAEASGGLFRAPVHSATTWRDLLHLNEAAFRRVPKEPRLSLFPLAALADALDRGYIPCAVAPSTWTARCSGDAPNAGTDAFGRSVRSILSVSIALRAPDGNGVVLLPLSVSSVPRRCLFSHTDLTIYLVRRCLKVVDLLRQEPLFSATDDRFVAEMPLLLPAVAPAEYAPEDGRLYGIALPIDCSPIAMRLLRKRPDVPYIAERSFEQPSWSDVVTPVGDDEIPLDNLNADETEITYRNLGGLSVITVLRGSGMAQEYLTNMVAVDVSAQRIADVIALAYDPAGNGALITQRRDLGTRAHRFTIRTRSEDPRVLKANELIATAQIAASIVGAV